MTRRGHSLHIQSGQNETLWSIMCTRERQLAVLGTHRCTVLLEKMDGSCRLLAYRSPRIFILTGSDNCRCLGLVS